MFIGKRNHQKANLGNHGEDILYVIRLQSTMMKAKRE